MKKIAKLLKADINASSDLSQIASMLASKGRGNDTILAHITPREAEILKAAGGSGTTNPDTGLLEFYDGEFTSGELAAQQFPDYGPAPVDTTAGLPFSTGAEPISDIPTTPVSTTYAAPSAADLGITYGFQPTGAEGLPSKVPTDFGPAIPAAPRMGYGVRDITAPSAVSADLTAPQEKSFLRDLTKGLTSQDMIRLGLAGGLGLVGQQQAKKAAGQAQAAAAEQKAIAQPYQAKGQELVRAAEAGELTPTSQQALQATQARLAQGVEQRGGVGAQQAATQLEAFRQQLLQQQYNYGLQVAQIGDSIAIGAIKSGLQADQAVQQATSQFYTSLAMVAGGLPLAQRTV